MKLKKEEVYINLQGKSKEELTELYDFLESVGEITYRDDIEWFLEYTEEGCYFGYDGEDFCHIGTGCAKNKTEVTIEQLKEILQPFTPISMRCTKEQFEAVKKKLKGCRISNLSEFNIAVYLVNNLGSECKTISNVAGVDSKSHNREVYEQWNEEIFLKACGIKLDSLEQQLEKAEAEVKRLKEEINKPKIGDWVNRKDNCIWKINNEDDLNSNVLDGCKKITNKQLIELLENESKRIL